MYRSSARPRTTLSRLVLAALLLLPLLALRLGAPSAAAQSSTAPVAGPAALAQTASGPYVVMLPMLAGGPADDGDDGDDDGDDGGQTPGSLPAELVGTWVAGNLSSIQLYDPSTNSWLPEVLGLGQIYELRADGTYTYAAQLTLGSFPCVSRSATYETGTVQADGARLELTATFYRNRTSICGGPPSESTELPEPERHTYLIQFDDGGFAQLYLDSGAATTNFVLSGDPTGQPEPMPMPGSLIGTWRSGALAPEGFFDPETRTWDESPAEGEWYRFNADGTYIYGGYGERVVDGCTQRLWLYATGRVEAGVEAVKLVPEYFPGPSLQRTYSSCQGGEPAVVVWQGGDEVLAWSLDSAGQLTLGRGPNTVTFTAD